MSRSVPHRKKDELGKACGSTVHGRRSAGSGAAAGRRGEGRTDIPG